MRVFTRLMIVGTAGLFVAGAGGIATAQTAQSVPTTCQSAAQAPGSETTQGAEPKVETHGVVELVGAALSKVCLSDEQRAAVEQAGKNVAENEQNVVEARRALLTTMADQIESGKIDHKALDNQIDALVSAREASSPTVRKAIEDFHVVLDASQREAFVDALEARMKEIRESSKGWFDTFAQDLKLTPDQKIRVRDALLAIKPELREERHMGKKLLEEFKSGSFSMESVSPVADVGERTREKAEGMVCVASELTDILTPDQRKILADKLRGKAEQMGGGQAPTGGPSIGTKQPAGQTQPGGVIPPAGQAQPGGVMPPAMQTQPGGVTPALGQPQPVLPTLPGGEVQPLGQISQPQFIAGYSSGGFGSWGGSYASRSVSMSTGYAAGYPLIGGYGIGVW